MPGKYDRTLVRASSVAASPPPSARRWRTGCASRNGPASTSTPLAVVASPLAVQGAAFASGIATVTDDDGTERRGGDCASKRWRLHVSISFNAQLPNLF